MKNRLLGTAAWLPAFAPDAGGAGPLTFQNDDARAEHIVSLLGDEPDPAPAGQGDGAAAATPAPLTTESTAAPAATDSGPEETSATAQPEKAKDEPAQPAIDPPKFWKPEARDLFQKLPTELQAILAQQAEEATKAEQRSISEAAEQRKAAERLQQDAQAKAEAAATERQRYVEQLNTVIQQVEAIDPILAEGRKADWAKMAAEDPAGTQAKWFQYQQRQQQLAAMVEERNKLVKQQMSDHFTREDAALLEKIPEWKDPAKGSTELRALKDTVRERYGFQPNELQAIADHRFVLIARDALANAAKVADLEAQLAAKDKAHADAVRAIEAKRVQPAPAKVLQPGNGNDGADADERTKAILKQARGIRRDDDRAALIARIL